MSMFRHLSFSIVCMTFLLHLFGCADGQVCVDGDCPIDPCAGVECSAGEECKDGSCVPIPQDCDPSERNACGGCSVLSGAPGDSCGDCGSLTCDGTDALTCAGSETNACGGCAALEGSPGDECGECLELACGIDPDVLECVTAEQNECGGCIRLDGAVGDPCGACGQLECDGADSLLCVESGTNACGGCETLNGAPGDSCGACGALACDGTDDLVCEEPGPLACGPVAIAPAGGASRGQALGINSTGEVVGGFFDIDPDTDRKTNRQAFIWDLDQGVRVLTPLSGDSGAWGINDNGLVSGFSFDSDSRRRAVLWDARANSVQDLGTLVSEGGDPGRESWGYGINNLGDVVGHADVLHVDGWSMWVFHGFHYSSTGGMRDLGTFTTDQPAAANGFSLAYSINDQGQIVGIAHAHGSDWSFFPFMETVGGGMELLPIDTALVPHDPDVAPEWYAVAINESGTIGGHVIAAPSRSLPYYWTDPSATPARIDLPEAFPYGEVYGINASGRMVGIMWGPEQEDPAEHAFMFHPDEGVTDLNSLIAADLGWVLNFARDINDTGQIVGGGTFNGTETAFLLSPEAYSGQR